MSKLFTLEFCVGTAMMLSLYLMDKAGKGNAWINALMLVVLAAVVIHPMLSLPWIWSAQEVAIRVWRASLLVCLLLLGVAWFGIWTWPDAIKKSVKSARVLYVETHLVLPVKEGDPVRIDFGLMNIGEVDATFMVKDRTYSFSTDPEQTVFKYQPTPSEEIQVLAIPNAIWHGEMRYDLRLTADMLEALNNGKARLFFFARGEYRDSAGKTYPLPFAEMYDGMFPGNLIAPPKNIVFQ